MFVWSLTLESCFIVVGTIPPTAEFPIYPAVINPFLKFEFNELIVDTTSL